MQKLKYLDHYNEQTKEQVKKLIKEDKLGSHLLNKYKFPHAVKNDKALFSYVSELKNEYLKKSSPLSKVLYDGKINVINNALGTHTIISRVQGSKLKTKNEIKISSLFKNAPEEFLKMIVVHELAHFKEKEHNKAFYNLCEFMQPAYHQVEFDLRLYLTHIEINGKMEEWA